MSKQSMHKLMAIEAEADQVFLGRFLFSLVDMVQLNRTLAISGTANDATSVVPFPYGDASRSVLHAKCANALTLVRDAVVRRATFEAGFVLDACSCVHRAVFRAASTRRPLNRLVALNAKALATLFGATGLHSIRFPLEADVAVLATRNDIATALPASAAISVLDHIDRLFVDAKKPGNFPSRFSLFKKRNHMRVVNFRSAWHGANLHRQYNMNMRG